MKIKKIIIIVLISLLLIIDIFYLFNYFTAKTYIPVEKLEKQTLRIVELYRTEKDFSVKYDFIVDSNNKVIDTIITKGGYKGDEITNDYYGMLTFSPVISNVCIIDNSLKYNTTVNNAKDITSVIDEQKKVNSNITVKEI